MVESSFNPFRLAESYQVLGLMITLGISVSVNVWRILIDGFCQLCQPGMPNDLFKKDAWDWLLS